MLAPCVSFVPFVAGAIPPKAVPDSSPLPVGSGGGASFWRAGLLGGVGAFDDGPALGGSCLGGIGAGRSISISFEREDGRGTGWWVLGTFGRFAVADGETGAEVTE